ncbi:hypothetical protein OCAE111667_01225 [Occultella aeris]|uniref:Uncharacterized protein n=1 Tax=Occultella aeris TaxID=2761496 RepID=A0A7M4DT43_9MICO|nr:hypothetical protein [Occultella aeris]VZO40637.1 hypothetical protein HALOF300_05345 [Occultella aeris]
MTAHMEQLEGELARLAQELTAVRPGECALCYVQRMLTTFDCDGTSRWGRRWAVEAGAAAPPGAEVMWTDGGPSGHHDARSVPGCDCDLFWSCWEPVAEAPTGRPAWPDPDRGCPESGGPAGMPGASGAGVRCRIWQRRRQIA